MVDPVWVDGTTPLNSANLTKLQTRDEKGAASGYAPLDSGGKVPLAQLPAFPTYAALSYATTLPASPVDGQEAILVDSITNPTYQWRFRYNAGSASAYKWEFVGGPSLQIETDTTDGTPSATYVALGTPGPLTTLARGGDYLFSFGCLVQSNAANANVGYMSLQIGATAANDTDAAYSPSIGAAVGAYGGMITRARRKTGIPASTTIQAMYKNLGFSMFFALRWMTVQPIRVS